MPRSALATLLNQREKAQDAEAKTSTVTAAKAMRAYSTDHDGNYAGATAADLTKIEPALAPGPRPDRRRRPPTTFTVSVDSAAAAELRDQHARPTATLSAPARQPGVGAAAPTADANGNRW